MCYGDKDEEDLDEKEMQDTYNLHVHGDNYVSNTSDEGYYPLEWLVIYLIWYLFLLINNSRILVFNYFWLSNLMWGIPF